MADPQLTAEYPPASAGSTNEPTLVQPGLAARTGEAGEKLGIFGDYELLTEIARGGMGIVYRARQITLNRVVALKMILAGRLADADDLQRFCTEAEAAARLQHPNVVAVFDVGEVDGQHFFSMEFIAGITLSRRLAPGPLPGRVAAKYLRTIARAVHYAHRQGILHRDLKPSNILIDADDEPHVTDFGLAKRLGGDPGNTRTGAVLGTPSYMAPEQAAGKTKELGPPCDVYGLGAVLYECLTGRPPFRAETAVDTVMQVLHDQPVPPRLLNTKVDPDLETICLKCLEKDPRDRYASAEELANDLERFLNSETISAAELNVLDRIMRMLDRSQHVVAFHTWSTMVFFVAAIVLVEHVAVFFLALYHFSHWSILAARASQFVLIGLVFWRNRLQLLPRTPAERELWTIWLAYVAAYFMNAVVFRLLFWEGFLAKPVEESRIDVLTYPFSAVLSGMAFCCMGSNYWGRFYAVGAGFFALALSMPLWMNFSPLVFGLAWSVALTAVAFHLRRLGRQQEAEKSGNS